MIEEDNGMTNKVQIKASDFGNFHDMIVEVGMSCTEIGNQTITNEKV